MKIGKRSIIQIAFTLFTIITCVVYYLYINGLVDSKVLSIGDINPYGGWSALKSTFTDPSYKWRGISRSIALTIGISLVALLMGRFFCGYMCPIGALQDFFKYLGRRLGIRGRRLPRGSFFKPEVLKYLILLIVLILSILGLGNRVSFYSPWLAYLNLFLGFNLQVGFFILLIIASTSLFIKRAFCRLLCPLGAFQSLLTVIGPSGIYANERCGGCTYCLRDCAVAIDKPDNGEISPECIRCLKCVETKCIRHTEGYTLKFVRQILNRNSYIAISLTLIIGIYLFFPSIKANNNTQSIMDLGILKDGTYIGTGIGFGGRMQVEVIIRNGRIVDINPTDHNETIGYFEEVFRRISIDIIESQNFNVDAISGATATSRGFINAVKSGINQALEGK